VKGKERSATRKGKQNLKIFQQRKHVSEKNHEPVTNPEELERPRTRSQNHGESRIILAEVGCLAL